MERLWRGFDLARRTATVTGFRILRIRGIPVEVHPSCGLLLGWLVIVGMGRLARPEIPSVTLITMVTACALLFVVSILLHELGHALWALRERWQVDRITLYGLGGLAWTRSGPYASPRAQLRVIAAGPLVTAALVVLFGATQQLGQALGWPRAVVDVAGLLTLLQVMLLVFNLAPAFPLDGGQMLRALLWRRSGDPAAATRTAMRAGAISAYVALAAGIVLLVSGRLFAGSIVAIAGLQILFILSAFSGPVGPARRPRAEVVGDLIRERPFPICADSGVDELLEQLACARGLATRAFPVTREGELVGYTSIGLASQVARERNGATVSEAMVPRDQAAVQLDANTPLEEALEKVPDVADRAIVVEDGLVTGIVLRRAIAQALLETEVAKRERRELAGLGW